MWKKNGRSSVVGRTSCSVPRVECVAVARQDQPGVVVERGLPQPCGGIGSREGAPAIGCPIVGRVQNGERELRRYAPERGHLGARERRSLEQESRDLVVLHDGEAIRGVAPSPGACLLRECHQTQPVEDPPRDGHHAAVREVVEVIGERLDRVERVLGEGVRAGGGGRPRVHERRLHDVVPVGAAPDEAPPVIHRNRDVRMRVDPARVIPKCTPHHVVGDDRVDFHAVHVAGPEEQRREQIASAARSDHERAEAGRPGGGRGLTQVIRERRQFVSQGRHPREVPVETDDGRGGRRVDVHEP